MKIMNLTHYDLDGAISSILIEKIFLQNTLFETQPIGYNYLESTIQRLSFNEYEKIFVTDLRLSENDIKILLEQTEELYYFDHHIYDYDIFSHTIKQGEINTEKCATKILFDKYVNYIPGLKDFEYLVELTNDYDMWILNDINSRILNNYFWEIKFWNFREIFSDPKNFNEHLPKMQELFKQHEQEIYKYIKQNEPTMMNNIAIYIGKNIPFEIPLYTHYKHYVLISDDTRMHIKSNVDLTDFYKLLENNENIETIGGHANAGGIVTKNQDALYEILYKFANYIENKEK